MPIIFLGLGYLVLAAAGAACWGFALASSKPGGAPAGRATSLLVTGGLAALAARVVVVWLLAQADPGFAQEKASVGLPVSAVTAVLAAVVWWMPRPGPSPRRDGITAGAFAAAAAASARRSFSRSPSERRWEPRPRPSSWPPWRGPAS